MNENMLENYEEKDTKLKNEVLLSLSFTKTVNLIFLILTIVGIIFIGISIITSIIGMIGVSSVAATSSSRGSNFAALAGGLSMVMVVFSILISVPLIITLVYRNKMSNKFKIFESRDMTTKEIYTFIKEIKDIEFVIVILSAISLNVLAIIFSALSLSKLNELKYKYNIQ